LSARSPLRRFASAPLPLWLAAFAIVLTVIFGDLPGEGQYMAVLQNGCHSPAFAALSLISLALLAPYIRTPLARAAVTVTAMVLVGAATEGIQSLFGRDAEFEDVVNDLAGSLAVTGYWLYLQWRGRPDTHARVGRCLTLLVSTAAVAYWLNPFWQCARAYWQRHAEFPVLAEFHSERDLYFVSSSGTDTHLVGTALQADLATGLWPGFTLSELMPDWRGYHVLKVDLGNPGSTELPLLLRVNDRAHRGDTDDRFNMELLLPPGARRTLGIPLEEIEHSPRTRKMDMSQITQLIVFRPGGAPHQVLRLYRVWLE
jgi:hypothetical protein